MSNPGRKVGEQFKNLSLTLGQVNTINHFFRKDPILRIKGLCTKCYRVSLPDKGFGVKYSLRGKPQTIPSNGIIKELRFSARKPPHNPLPYVTELVVAPEGIDVWDQQEVNGVNQDRKMTTRKGDLIWTMFDPRTERQEFSTTVKRRQTHIPASCYDFDKLSYSLEVCLCKM